LIADSSHNLQVRSFGGIAQLVERLVRKDNGAIWLI
jgi:hypothetical protein